MEPRCLKKIRGAKRRSRAGQQVPSILTSKLFEALSSDKQMLDAQKGIRELASRLAKRKLKPPSSFKASSEIKGGSLISVLAPPYDAIWAQNLGDASSNQSSEDDLGGTFGLDVTADGSAYAASAIGAFYRPVSNSRVGHFRPFMRYSYHYVDSAWLGNPPLRAAGQARWERLGLPDHFLASASTSAVSHSAWSASGSKSSPIHSVSSAWRSCFGSAIASSISA